MKLKRDILVVEDEESISNFISTTLKTNGYNPIVARTGEQAKSMFSSHCPDLIVLDLGLPDIDGIEVIDHVRQWSQIPIIIVSARDKEAEKVKALDMGADDYITKPFGISEFLARIRTVLRHADRAAGELASPADVITVKDLTLDLGKRTVAVAGKDIHLTQIEFKILALLCKYAGRVVTYDFIIKQIWGPHAPNDNQVLRVNMANIRRKLKENPADPKYILTELGVGYRMLEDSE
jgi:two-component system KDP operon response regulator KdpE